MRSAFLGVLFVVSLFIPRSLAAEDGPLDAAFRKAHEDLAQMEQQLRALRGRASSDLIGKDSYHWPQDPLFVPIVQADIDQRISAAIGTASAARRDLIRRRRSWDSEEMTLDVFYDRTYADIERAVPSYWKAHIDVALLYINSWIAEVQRLTRKQSDTQRATVAQLQERFGYGSPRYDAGLRALERKQSQERRDLFMSIGKRYTALRDDLARVREQWSTEMWRWVDFAHRRIDLERDVHARAKSELHATLLRSFGYGRSDGVDSDIDYMCNFPGSPDRIITGYYDAWLTPPPFPDLQIQDGCPGCLRMNSLGRIAVEKYRAEDEPADRLRAASVRLSPMDPEREITEAIPLQFIRISAQSSGFPTTEAGDRLVARIGKRGGASIDVVLKPWSADPHPLYVSDPILIATPGADRNDGTIEVPGCTGDEIEARVAEFSTKLDVGVPNDANDPAPCLPPPDPPRLRIEARSALSLTFDPDDRGDLRLLTGFGDLPRDTRGMNMPNPPEVRLLDENKQPLEEEQIVWVIPEREQTYVTYTDADGVSRLDFRVGARGTFAASVDGVPTGEPIPDGKYRLLAAPSDPTFAALLEGGPAEFEIDFVSPSTIDVIDSTGARLDALVSQQRFGVRVWLGRKDLKTLGNPKGKVLKVRLDPPIRLREPLIVEARHVNGRAFESGFLYSARTEASIRSSLERLTGGVNLLVEPGEIVTLSYSGTSVGAVVYPNDVRLAEARIRAGLLFWRDSIETQLSATHDGASRLRLLRLRGFMTRGLEWLDDANLPLHYRVPVAGEYLGLLEVPDQALGLYAQPRAFSRFGSASHNFVCGFEEGRVTNALEGAYQATIVTTGERLRRVGGGFVDFIVGMPDMLFVTPFLGGYTAITGWTADGETASTFERILGGFDAVTAAFGTAQIVRGAALRAVSAGRAAFSAGQRAVIGEGLTSGALSFTRTFAAETGVALARQAPEYVVEGIAEAVGREIFVGTPGVSERVEISLVPEPAILMLNGRKRSPRPGSARARLNRSVQYREKYHGARMSDLSDAANKIDVLEREIRDLTSQLGSASPAQRRELTAQLNSRKTRLQQVDQRLTTLAKRARRHSEVLERSNRALNELRDISLSDEYVRQMLRQNPSWRPYGSQSVAGTRAQIHYERQIATSLEKDGFVRGTRNNVRTAYRSPLDEGYLAGAGGGRQRQAVTKPTPDHINPETLEMGDSKYYKPFDQLQRKKTLPGGRVVDEFNLCAAEIADTVEKARLVQEQLLFERLKAQKLAAGKVVNESRLRQKAASQLRSDSAPKITIYTPEDMPAEIQNAIRKLSPPGGAVQFKTVPPKILNWLGS